MSDLRAAVQAALGAGYRVEREVRPVGACRLFVAEELGAGAELLVKVLPAELSLAVDAELFAREVAGRAERLRHPGLVPTRDAGRAGAWVYHTRPFIEGTTLRAALVRQGELPLRQVVDVLRDVLGALAHAHAAGVAHGDLKPEQVILAGGRALVADTGIVDAVARALPGGAASPVPALCAAPYLAPERRAQNGPPAPRDDVFAVGVLAHEMLTGRAPAPDAESLEEARAVPGWLLDLVRRCLAPASGGRWADAAAALAALDHPRAGPA